jgi:hypothetical protein
MGKSFEYKFVRLGEYAGSALFGVHDKARNTYSAAQNEHEERRWRPSRSSRIYVARLRTTDGWRQAGVPSP